MQKILYKYSLTELQRLFVEKSLELCHLKSLDSYRAKVACPTYILFEFYSIMEDLNKGKVKYYETFISFRDEMIDVLKDDYLLDYGRMTKSYFIEILLNTKDRDSFNNLSQEIEHALYYLITKNENYKEQILEKLKFYIDNGKKLCIKCSESNFKGNECIGCTIACFKEVERLTGILMSELLNFGYSKGYIHKYIKAKFTHTPIFEDSWKDFSSEFSSNRYSEMKIVFKLYALSDKLNKIQEGELKKQITSVDLLSYERVITNEKISNWLKPHGGHRYMLITVDALDYGQAMKKAKTELSNLLDLMYLGYSDTRLDVDAFALVYDEVRPQNANLQPIHYSIDGSFKSTPENYIKLRNKVLLIKNKAFISLEVQDKIETAIRYLRAGSEALELEQKFLNYWIGLENIFSNNNPKSKTFDRITKYFIISHSISYTKRNLTELHKDIIRIGAGKKLSVAGNTDIHYLTSVESYNTMISLANDFPLLSHRARGFKSIYFKNSEDRENHIKKHGKNLERHLVRMYRVRNQLVHEAAIMQNIENITGNLRYYLTFILNKMIDFFSDCKEKPGKDNKILMEEFFSHQELIWLNLEKKKWNIESLIRVPHSVDFIS